MLHQKLQSLLNLYSEEFPFTASTYLTTQKRPSLLVGHYPNQVYFRARSIEDWGIGKCFGRRIFWIYFPPVGSFFEVDWWNAIYIRPVSSKDQLQVCWLITKGNGQIVWISPTFPGLFPAVFNCLLNGLIVRTHKSKSKCHKGSFQVVFIWLLIYPEQLASSFLPSGINLQREKKKKNNCSHFFV